MHGLFGVLLSIFLIILIILGGVAWKGNDRMDQVAYLMEKNLFDNNVTSVMAPMPVPDLKVNPIYSSLAYSSTYYFRKQ